jgi:hypothetical protein
MRNGGLDDIVREALTGQVASRFRRRAAASDDAPSALRLALERSDRSVRDLRLDSGERELVPDARVPRSPVGERRCPRRRVAAIVDERCAQEPVENVLPVGLADAATLQIAVDLGRGALTMPQRPKCLLERRVRRCRRLSSRREPPLRPR